MVGCFLAFVLLALFSAIPFAGAATDPYEINAIVPMTGGAAFLAKEEVASLGVVEKVVNDGGGIAGRPIAFTFLDDQTNPQVAVQLANQVLSTRFGRSGLLDHRAVQRDGAAHERRAGDVLLRSGKRLFPAVPGDVLDSLSPRCASSARARTPLQIRDYLASVKGWTGINGTYDFDKVPQRGLGPGSIVVVQWDTAKATWVGVSALGGTPLR